MNNPSQNIRSRRRALNSGPYEQEAVLRALTRSSVRAMTKER